MSGWIDYTAVWEIVVVGLLAGAGLPALFALGLRALGTPARGRGGARGQAGSGALVGGSPAGAAVAALCFGIVLAAISYGIYIIVASGHK
jgi:hypothetical protein